MLRAGTAIFRLLLCWLQPGGGCFISAGLTNFLTLTGSVSSLVPPKPLIQWKP